MNVLIIWCLYADFKHLGDQNHREKSCYVASEFIALSLLVGICENFDIYYSGYIQTHCQKNTKIKRADQILPEVYGTTLKHYNMLPRFLPFFDQFFLSVLTMSYFLCVSFYFRIIISVIMMIFSIRSGLDQCRLSAWARWAVARGPHANLGMVCIACYLMFKHCVYRKYQYNK